MTASITTIRNLIAERSAKTKPLILELTTVVRDDSKPVEYRQRRERELRAEISKTNDDYSRRIGAAAVEAAKDPQRRMAAGTPLKPEHLTEAQLLVEEYRGRSRQEQRGLVNDLIADLRADNTTGARIKARAAATLRIPLGSLAPQLNQADPAKRDAQDALDVIEGLAELALAEPLRELAAAGLASARERVHLMSFADQRGLRPDVPFAAQVEPDYSGPAVKDGVPVSPFPEPHDPKRDAQRAKMERMGRDGSTPADTAARYAARFGGRDKAADSGDDNLGLYE